MVAVLGASFEKEQLRQRAVEQEKVRTREMLLAQGRHGSKAAKMLVDQFGVGGGRSGCCTLCGATLMLLADDEQDITL